MLCEIGEDAVVKLSQRDHIPARIDAAKREILAADGMVKLMTFRSKADAIRQLVRASRDMQLINLANELKLRCETRLGEMLRKTQLSKGGSPAKTVPEGRKWFYASRARNRQEPLVMVSASRQRAEGQVRARDGRGANRRNGS
jgi:hypothetical protein